MPEAAEKNAQNFEQGTTIFQVFKKSSVSTCLMGAGFGDFSFGISFLATGGLSLAAPRAGKQEIESEFPVFSGKSGGE